MRPATLVCTSALMVLFGCVGRTATRTSSRVGDACLSNDECPDACIQRLCASLAATGEPCDDKDDCANPDNDCLAGLCAPPDACGNGVIDATETCDDGNTVPADGCDANCQTEGLPPPTVSPAYPTSGSHWNDYVKNDDPLLDRFHQSDDACDGSETGDQRACIHGGEKRIVAVTSETRCAPLSLVDDLGAFDWRCFEEDGAVSFYSVGLRRGSGLTDLVIADAWRPNRVRLYKNDIEIAQSAPARWWDNEVQPVPTNPGTGVVVLTNITPGRGTIYTVPSSDLSSGYNLNSDKAAIVRVDESVLSYDEGFGPSCNTVDGEAAGANNHCGIAVGGQNFVWVEVHVKGLRTTTTGTYYGIFFFNSLFGVIRASKIYDNRADGLNLTDSHYSLVVDTRIGNSGGDGLHLENSDFSRIHNCYIAASAGNGLETASSHTTVVTETATFSNGHSGMRSHCSTGNNIYSGILIGNNDDATYSGAFTGTCNTQVTLNHMTVVNSNRIGVNIDQTVNYTVNQVVIVNGQTGFALYNNANRVRTSQLVATNHSTRAIYGANSNAVNTYIENLILGSNALNCDTANTGDGLINDTCSDTGVDGSSSYAGFPGTTATVRTGRDGADMFVGKITADDTANSSDDDSSPVAAGTISDWIEFESNFRGWGLDGGVFPATDHRTECTGAGSCVVWDFRLVADASNPILNRSGDGSTINTVPFTAGAICPPEVHGDKAVTDRNASANVFLINAQEIVGDEIGDDNGLCESDEACLYSPNFGAYQGEGDPAVGACAFQDGTITNVTMYAHPTNGVPQ